MNANASVMAFQYMPLECEAPACKLAYDRPNLSVYAADGAVIGGVKGAWKPGDPPKNWEQIRATFWGTRHEGGTAAFLLGDFALFARFCALAQASDMSRQPATDSLLANFSGSENSIVARATTGAEMK